MTGAAPAITGAPLQQWSAPRRTSADAADAPSAGDIDSGISSTTPDARRRHGLPVVATLAWGAGLGLGIGALLLRPSGLARVPGLVTGMRNGAIVGGGMGVALLGLDRLTHGAVGQQADSILLDRRAQAWFVLGHPTKPWLARMGLRVATDARAAQEQLYGRREPLDGPQDAFRHAYAAALYAQRMMEQHGVDPAEARALSAAAGRAHEVDGQDNNDEFSHAMDFHNNQGGLELVGDGHGPDGSWLTEAQLRSAVLDAMAHGKLELVDRSGRTPAAVATTPRDLPPSR